ncbi:MAG: restriction endonuclease [Spirulinaceae cyanobacterium]
MTIPDYQSIMLPLLELAGDRNEHSLREAIETLADEFKLTTSERKELLPSGQQAIFDNRVGWARTYLKKAGLLETTRRGYFRINERGLNVLQNKPPKINSKFLEQFDEYLEFRTKRNSPKQELTQEEHPLETPEESLEAAYQKLREDLAAELLQTILQCSPTFFERLVVDLLIKMGYGGSRKEAGQALGKSRDGGIDGIIKEDKLGLDIIYIQAKRWEGTVGRPEIQKFAGALQGNRAKKGIFLTTSGFSKEATEYVKYIDSKIILIDGDRLSEYMIDYNVGASPIASYEVKRIDVDYFLEE